MWDMSAHVSNLQFRSIGIVAANKDLDSTVIKALPVELLPDLDVDLTDVEVEMSKTAVDYYQNEYTVTVKKKAAISAEWMGSTNRKTSPDVRRGEQVRLYQAGDSTKWFWASMGRDDHLRRLETVIYTWNANPTNADAEPGPSNTYSFEVSAHNKLITLKTSAANDEVCTYTFQMDTGNGVLVIEDDDENHFFIDTAKTIIEIRNKDQSVITMDKKQIRIQSDDRIDMETTDFKLVAKTVAIECDTYSLTATDSVAITSSTYKASATESYDIVTKAFSVNGSTSIALSSPSITLTGPVTVSGTLSQSDGTVQMGGGATFGGDVAFEKKVNITGDLKVIGSATFIKPITAPNV